MGCIDLGLLIYAQLDCVSSPSVLYELLISSAILARAVRAIISRLALKFDTSLARRPSPRLEFCPVAHALRLSPKAPGIMLGAGTGARGWRRLLQDSRNQEGSVGTRDQKGIPGVLCPRRRWSDAKELMPTPL